MIVLLIATTTTNENDVNKNSMCCDLKCLFIESNWPCPHPGMVAEKRDNSLKG